jgi:hypothetical protein
MRGYTVTGGVVGGAAVHEEFVQEHTGPSVAQSAALPPAMVVICSSLSDAIVSLLRFNLFGNLNLVSIFHFFKMSIFQLNILGRWTLYIGYIVAITDLAKSNIFNSC